MNECAEILNLVYENNTLVAYGNEGIAYHAEFNEYEQALDKMCELAESGFFGKAVSFTEDLDSKIEDLLSKKASK